jgi:hypothetical protein
MKRVLFSIILGFSSIILLQAQIGINTTDPKASLDVQATTFDGTTAEGLIVPRLTLAQLILKDPKYGVEQTGTLIYVTNTTGTTTAKTKKVIVPGYYCFDGTIWQNMSLDQSLRFFYMPSIVLPTDTSDPAYDPATQTFRIDLYTEYTNQFGLSNTGSSIKSPGATGVVTLPNNAFEYLITYYDNTVFKNMSVSSVGVLTYKLPDEIKVTDKTFMNIVFKLK